MNRWEQAPWWVMSLVTGAMFLAIIVVVQLVRDGESLGQALTANAIGGVLFGLVMGPALAHMRRRMLGGVPHTSPEQLQAARRAAARGPVPADALTRDLAAQIVRRQLDQSRRQRTPSLVLCSLLICLYVWLAVTSSPWWLITGAGFTALVVLTARQPARLERRLTLLSRSPEPAA